MLNNGVKYKEHDPDDPGEFLGNLRQLAQAGNYEEGLRLIRKSQAKERTQTKAERKSQVLEYIEHADPGNLDLDKLEGQFEIEGTYNKPAPTWRDFRHKAPQEIGYFVDGLIMENARCYLASPSKFGKSFLIMYLAICAASGKPFFDRKVKQCPVMFIDKENDLALNLWRSDAIGRGLGLSPEAIDSLPIMPLFREDTTLTDEASIERLKRYIGEFRPGLVIVDTLIRCTRGLDENSAHDMNELAEVIAELSHDTGQDFVFVFLHHTNKSKDNRGQERVRGSGDITAMVDHGFMLDKTGVFGTETFHLSEASTRHGHGQTISYRLAVNEAQTGDMVSFIKQDNTSIEVGSNGQEGLDKKNF